MKALKIIDKSVITKGLTEVIPVIQSDSGRQVKIVVTDMIIPSGATARIYALKPDKREIYNICAVSGNEVTVNLTTQMLAVVGSVNCQINIVSGTDIITSFGFVLEVEKSLVTGSAIESKNEFTALETALKTASGLQSSIDKVNDSLQTVNNSLASKKNEEYGLFVDNRAEATTGYWHKLFTCKTTATANTNICMNLSVIGFYPAQSLPSGILTLNIRQGSDGSFLESASVFKWQSTTIDMTNLLNRFAVNVVTSITGNYVEFYIYNNTQYTGYKVSVIDKSLRGTGSLTFTGYITSSATTTLTRLPTDGTIAYSTLSNSSFNPVLLWSGSTKDAGTILDLSKSINNYKSLIIQYGTPASGNVQLGYGSTIVRRWLESATTWLDAAGTVRQIAFTTPSGYIQLGLVSETELSVLHADNSVRAVYGVYV